jgi:hypothetical protein
VQVVHAAVQLVPLAIPVLQGLQGQVSLFQVYQQAKLYSMALLERLEMPTWFLTQTQMAGSESCMYLEE